MSCGYIYNGRNPIQWIPDGIPPKNFAFKKARKGITLYHKQASILNGYSAEAFYCDACRVVIAKTTNN